MGALKYLILHNSATPNNREVTKADIEQWHLKERGWSRVGYSKLFQRSGNVVDFYDIDSDQWIDADEITNGATGFNSISVHWCFAGGTKKDGSVIFGRPDEIISDNQFLAFRTELNDFLKYHQEVKIIGHNQVANKECPGFNVSELLRLLGVPSKFILEGKIK
jgi:N-acetylmuramoyl-L-alanine amidase